MAGHRKVSNRHSTQKYIIRKESSQKSEKSYSDSKERLEELYRIYNECQPNCRLCDKYIYLLSQHVRRIHAVAGQEKDQFVQVTEKRSLRPRKSSDYNAIKYASGSDQSQEFDNTETTNLISEVKVEDVRFEIDFKEQQLGLDASSLMKVDTYSDSDPLQNDGGNGYDFGDVNEHYGNNDRFGTIGESNSNTLNGMNEIQPSSKTPKPLNANAKILICNLCNKEFNKNRNLYRHCCRGHKSDTMNSSFPQCSKCELRFSDTKYLTYHLRNVHRMNVTDPRNKTYECRICKKKCLTLGELNIHFEKSHSGEKPYICEFCQAEYSTPCQLKYHTRIHTGETPFECYICNKKFRLKFMLKHHLRIHTDEGPIIYNCKTCERTFKTNYLLIVHTRSKHTGEKPFMCDVCSKCFPSKRQLKTHMLFHKGERNYICKHCNKRFITSTNLHFHEKLHSGTKDIICEICGKDFHWQHTLKLHMKVHNKNK